jgi:hypothetical protein
VIW